MAYAIGPISDWTSPGQLGKVRGGLFWDVTLLVGPFKFSLEPGHLSLEGCVFATAHTVLFFSKAHPKVKAFVRHAQALGHIHHPITTVGHLLYCLSSQVRSASDSHQKQLADSTSTLTGFCSSD